MKIRRFLLFICLVSVACTVLAAKEVRLLPKEQWAMSEDGQFAYATAITDDSITLQLELFSPHLKMQSQTAGMLAYIDLTGKKKEKYSVAFPVVKGFIEHITPKGFGTGPNERKERPQRGEVGEWKGEGMNAFAIDFDTLQIPATVRPVLTGDSYASLFVGDDEQMLSPDDVALSYTGGRMFYSLSLPLEKFGTKRNKKGLFSIAIALRENSRPMPKGDGMPPSGGGFGGHPGGGMGGPDGGFGGPGGMGGGPHRGMGRPDDSPSPRNQQYKQWLLISL